jgi:hypothetical protein
MARTLLLVSLIALCRIGVSAPPAPSNPSVVPVNDPSVAMVTDSEMVVAYNRVQLMAAEKMLPGVLTKKDLPAVGTLRANMRAQRDRVNSAKKKIDAYLKKNGSTKSESMDRLKALSAELALHVQGGEIPGDDMKPVRVAGWDKNIAAADEVLRSLRN